MVDTPFAKITPRGKKSDECGRRKFKKISFKNVLYNIICGNFNQESKFLDLHSVFQMRLVDTPFANIDKVLSGSLAWQ